jgi:hypothetical protein
MRPSWRSTMTKLLLCCTIQDLHGFYYVVISPP